MAKELLTEEDIKALATAACNTRDKALILSLYESGCRIGEFLPMKLKHVNFDKYGTLFRVTGMAGEKGIRLVASTLALQSWISDHPCENNPEAYLWCKTRLLNNPERKNNHLSYGFICRILNELAEKAEIKKSVNPHRFRYARATFLARCLKEPEISEFFGWNK